MTLDCRGDLSPREVDVLVAETMGWQVKAYGTREGDFFYIVAGEARGRLPDFFLDPAAALEFFAWLFVFNKERYARAVNHLDVWLFDTLLSEPKKFAGRLCRAGLLACGKIRE